MRNTQNKLLASVMLINQEKKDGVKPEYDIRTDRFEIAREAMETLEKGIQLSYSDPDSAKVEETTTKEATEEDE